MEVGPASTRKYRLRWSGLIPTLSASSLDIKLRTRTDLPASFRAPVPRASSTVISAVLPLDGFLI